MLRSCERISPLQSDSNCCYDDRMIAKLLPACGKKNFLPAGNSHTDLAVLNFRNGSPLQGHVAGASSRTSGNAVATHHGAAADPNCLADFDLLQNSFLVIVVSRSAPHENNQHKEDDHSLRYGNFYSAKEQHPVHDYPIAQINRFCP
jgi:hypothetical protein